jgi:hypothetical protein
MISVPKTEPPTSTTPEKKDFDAQEKKEQTPLDGMLNFLAQPVFNLLQR